MIALLKDSRIDWELLETYNFNRDLFEELSGRIAAKRLSPATSIFTGKIEPVTNVVSLDWENKEHKETGETALRRGEVAVLVLNGGMATRFGNVVKGTVEVFDGLSFLALKANDLHHASEYFESNIPLILMNSFATQSMTEAHVFENMYFNLPPKNILSFVQSISLRMNLDGSLFIGDDEKPSYHAPGHGDFLESIRKANVLSALLERGCKYLLFSNVDNLGATIDATIIGQHIYSKASMTAELTERCKNSSGEWDAGGAPAIADGLPQLLEGFRFPDDFDHGLLPDFSTNNFIFNLKDIDRVLPLPRHVVEKKVDGHTVLQIESITCEASGIYDADGVPALTVNYLRVPRDGSRGRFFPIKSKQDLEDMRPLLKVRLDAGKAFRTRS